MISHRVAKDPRLQQIIDFLARLARGDFEARMTPSDRGDGIDAIIVGQNMLAEELQASFEALHGARDELEQRVMERTADLEKANEELKTEIAERKQAEETVRESQERYRTLAESAQDHIFIIDRERHLQYMNSSSAASLRLSPKETIGKTLAELFPAQVAERQWNAIQRVFDAGKPFAVQDTIVSPEGARWLDAQLIPLLTKSGEVRSVMGITRDITELKQAEEKLAAKVTELERRNNEITSLNEMGDLLQTSLDAEEVYAAIKQSFQKLFPDWSGTLYMFNASRNLLETVTAWGEVASSEDIFAPEECRALRRGRVYQVEDTSTGVLCQHVARKTKAAEDDFPAPAGYLCVPMMAKSETIGTLYLETARDPEQLSAKQPLATAMSEQIALALANLRLHETLKRQSIRDPLTGLFNRRYMEESLGREFSRAVRKQHTVGIIMFDIDHFKNFNDTHGHDAGDAVLQDLGAFLQKHFRGEDIICRYVGEEFVLILPDASLDDTRKRAEFLREEVRHLDVYHRGKPLNKFTLSFGVAVFPDRGNDAETVLRAADQALYRAKQEGRDRVVVA